MRDPEGLYSMGAFDVGDILSDAFHNLFTVEGKDNAYYTLSSNKEDWMHVKVAGDRVLFEYKLFRRAAKTGKET